MKKPGRRLLCLLLALLFVTALLPVTAQASPNPVPYACPESANGAHNWVPVDYIQVPTCTASGTYFYMCSNCGEYTDGTYGDAPALGHNWYISDIFGDRSCTEGATYIYTCSNCGEKMSEDVAPFGHDWVETPAGDGTVSVTCSRCGAAYSSSVFESAAEVFSTVRWTWDWSWLTEDDSDLRIVQDPVGGSLLRNSGETLVLTVEVAGGEPPYSYEWHSRSNEPDAMSAVLNMSMLDLNEEVYASYNSAAAEWYGANAKHADAFNADWAQLLTSEDVGGVSSLLENLSFFDKGEGGGDSPEYVATRGNCTYWVEVTDNAGNTVTSAEADVYYRVRIAEQPRNVNWRSDVDEDLQAVFLECRAADGSGQYRYFWFRSGDGDIAYDIGERCGATDLGDYYCKVIDSVTGEEATSNPATVYDLDPLTIYSVPGWVTMWPEEEWTLTAAVKGGVPPYEVWWDCDGVPLLTWEAGTNSDGNPCFEAVGTATGLYTAHATDAMGATDVCATPRFERHLTISQQPEGGTLPAGGRIGLTLAVSDGKPPYTYMLFHDGKRTRTTRGSGTYDPSYTFNATETGEYYIVVRDSEGHSATSNTVYVDCEELRIASQTLSAEFDGSLCYLSVVVEGGVPPYSYEWTGSYPDKGWSDVVEGFESMLQIFTVGVYQCKVTDSVGNVVHSHSIPVEYTGAKPLIIVQPICGIVEEVSDAQLVCEAIGSQGSSGLQYIWEWTSGLSGSSGWVQTGAGRVFYPDKPGYYRCKVTDTATGEYVYSNMAGVFEHLKVKGLEYLGVDGKTGEYTISFTIKGGTPFYTASVFATVDGKSQKCGEIQVKQPGPVTMSFYPYYGNASCFLYVSDPFQGVYVDLDLG